jgi:hypothetical protein
MDNKRFDDLAKKLASTASRRGTLKGMLGAGLASAVALVTGRDADAQDVSAARCIANNKVCGTEKGLPCGKCCSGFSERPRPGKAERCRCRPNGTRANPNRPGQCCSGFVNAQGRCATDFRS